MPRYAIVKDFPAGFSTFDLPDLLSRGFDKIPPTTHDLEMHAAAQQYVEMVEAAESLGLCVEYIEPRGTRLTKDHPMAQAALKEDMPLA